MVGVVEVMLVLEVLQVKECVMVRVVEVMLVTVGVVKVSSVGDEGVSVVLEAGLLAVVYRLLEGALHILPLHVKKLTVSHSACFSLTLL